MKLQSKSKAKFPQSHDHSTYASQTETPLVESGCCINHYVGGQWCFFREYVVSSVICIMFVTIKRSIYSHNIISVFSVNINNRFARNALHGQMILGCKKNNNTKTDTPLWSFRCFVPWINHLCPVSRYILLADLIKFTVSFFSFASRYILILNVDVYIYIINIQMFQYFYFPPVE